MNRTYECMLLLDNREVKKGWDELKSTVNSLFDKHGAEVVSARRWDERRLTFPIKRQKRATYLLMYVNADTPQVQAIRRDMEFSETVLRNFVVACEKIPESAFEPEESFDIASIRIDDDPPASAAPDKTEAAETKAEAPTEEGLESEGTVAVAAAGDADAEAGDQEPAGEVVPTGDEVPSSEDVPSGEDAPSGEELKEDK